MLNLQFSALSLTLQVLTFAAIICPSAELSWVLLMFSYFEKKNLLFVVPVKSTVKILQKFVAFSEYMNFTVARSSQS